MADYDVGAYEYEPVIPPDPPPPPPPPPPPISGYDVGCYEFVGETPPPAGPTTDDSLSRLNWQGQAKLYIKNDAGAWVDFSARFTNDRLVSFPEIRHVTEGEYGQPVTRTVKVTVTNEDRYWDAAPTGGFTTFLGRDVQLRMLLADAVSEYTLFTGRIAPDGIETDDGEYATLEIEPLTEWLARVDASGFKRGLQRYEFKPWLYLARELVRSEFGDATTGAMPSGYLFPQDPRVTFPDGANHFSVWGKPPQWDGASWNDDNTDIPWDLDGDDTTLWVLIGVNLWEYTIATDTWTNRGQDASIGTGIAAKYCRVGTDYILVLKWTTDADMIQTDLHFTLWDKVNEEWNATSRGTVTNFFPGWHYFNGTADSGARYKGDSASHNIGTNLIVPFPQTPLGISATETSYIRDAIHDSTGSTTQAYNEPFPAQWYSLYNATGAAFGAAVHWGGRQNIEAKVSTNTFTVYYCSYALAYSEGMISKISFAGGSSIGSPADVLNHADIPTGSLFFAPRLDSTDGTDLFYIRFDESFSSGNEDTTSVRVSDISSIPAAQTALFTNAALGADNYSYVIDIIWANGAADDLFIIVLEVDRVNLWPTYRVVRVNDYNTTPLYYDVEHSTVCFRAPKKRSYTYPWWTNQETGSIGRASANSSTIHRIDGGVPPVFDAPFCPSFFLTGSELDPSAYGISHPYHNPETQEATPDGKYYLWQCSTKHSGRVELADFTDLNKLEAASLLCAAYGHVVYVDRSGNWIVKPRDTVAVPTTVIEKDFQGTKGWLGIGRKKATEIENYLEMTPYETTLAPMETKIYQKATSTYNGTVTATQLDRLERRVRLRCLTGGKVSTGKTRWDFLVFYGTVETRLGAAYSSGTSATLESVEDIAVGDSIAALNSEVRTVATVTAATKVVTFDTGWALPYPILSEVTIAKTNNNKWSSLGVTILAEALDSSETGVDVDDATEIPVGSYIVVGDEEMLVTAKTGSTLTVTRGDNASAHADNATVGVILKPGGLGKMVNIGGQNIAVMFERDGDADEEPVSTGDYIEFTCPGMVLAPSPGSRVIVTDGTSIAAYGKRKPKRAQDNRFLTRTLGEYALTARRDRYKDPKRVVEVRMGFDLQYYLYDVAWLRSAELFPSVTENVIPCIVREVGDNPFANKTVYVLEEQ